MDIKFITAVIGMIAALIIIFNKKLRGKNKPTQDNVSNKPTQDNISNDSPDSVISNGLLSSLYNMITDIHKKYNLVVPVPACFAVIEQEGGYNFIVLQEDNNKIIGDNGKAVGIMQLHSIAVRDVNEYYGLDFNDSDRKDLGLNLSIGLLYLNSCYLTAKSKSVNPVWLSFKMYNGGRDETDLSPNSMANNYADKCYTKYQNYVDKIIIV